MTLKMDGDPPTDPTPPPPSKDKKTFKSYLASVSRKVSQKTVSGAQHLGTLARSATISRSKGSKMKSNNITPATSAFTPTTTTPSAPKKDVTPAPRLPHVVYRSPDADFIESHMEARIRSIGSNGEGEKTEGKEGEDRMGGYTIRLIDPRTNGT